ncbi:hypothetical protein [Cellulomonas sp. KRMCY2]|uniref:hypothetical protein n=1 Tax=Cellulomonas sp. KRMCY2 TaxID=1304865 RepID=UPI00045E9738|nr:hypothetical protein [Cellulomonas sp. KRMCY2]
MGLWCTQTGAGGWLSMVVLWVAVVALIVWGVGRLFPAQPAPDAYAVLESRLASGEIDPETYRLIRRELDRLAPVETKGS